VLVGACAVLAGLMLLPAALGFQRYVITGKSMTGAIDRGSLVYDRPVATSQLKVGDVITYTPPAGAGTQGRVTHRIEWIGHSHGRAVFQTKGDANRVRDPWKFTLPHATQARVSFHLPYLGYVFSALSIRWVRMLVIGLPALLIAMAVLAGLWREAGAARRREPATQGLGA
jgi:signal peptidase